MEGVEEASSPAQEGAAAQEEYVDAAVFD